MLRASSIHTLLIVCMFALASSTMLAQTQTKAPKDTQKTTGKTSAKKFRGRLPNGYGQIGITQKQRATIYGIQEKYHTEIEELQQRLDALKEKESEEIYNVLTEDQKAALKARQDKRKTARKTATDKEDVSKKAAP